MINTAEIAPPGKVFSRLRRPGIRFGKPLDFSRYEGMEGDRYILRAITDEVMYEIMRLSGQEYVDVYASRAKEEAKRAAKAEKAQVRPITEAPSTEQPDGTSHIDEPPAA